MSYEDIIESRPIASMILENNYLQRQERPWTSSPVVAFARFLSRADMGHIFFKLFVR